MKRMVVLRALPLACGLVLALAVQSPEAFGASWATGVEAILPGNAGSNPNVFLASVSCASTGKCSAAGSYNNSSGNQQGLLLAETPGAWAMGAEASLPAGAASRPNVSLPPVSWASAGNSSAVGDSARRPSDPQG